MSIRALGVVAVALVVLTVVAVVSQRTPDGATRSDSLLAPNLREHLDDIEAIVIRKAGDEIVATLERGEQAWTVAERGGYPADTTTIRGALTALAEARIVEEKTANPALYERLGLGDLSRSDARGISVTFLPEDPSTPAVVLGDSEGTSYRYARLEGHEQSFLINADPELPGDTAGWLVPEIIDVSGDRIERIVITHADGERLEIFKTEVGQANYSVADIPEGRELQYPGVANVTGNALRDLRLEDVAPVDPNATELDEPEFVTEFTTFDGLIVRAEGRQVDVEGWLAFSARPDTEFTRGTADDASAEEPAAADAPSASEDARDPAAEAAAINARVAGWRYRIPSYQYSQIARRMDDLLRAEESTD